MAFVASQIRVGAYFDSAVLMQLQRGLLGLPNVRDAGCVMATPANLDILASNELLPSEARSAKANDLLIVVKADDEASANAAVAQVDALIARRASSVSSEFRARTVELALRQLPEARWVLVSVPGRFAAGVAREALRLERNVFLYSDNVSIADEVELKTLAKSKGLLVMGPDCGTAIVNGVGLGFANRVRRGRIGVVAASGTGAQAVSVGIHRLGSGVSQLLGTGGRDLKTEVGGATMAMALDALARDDETDVIVLVSKPPSREVASDLLARAMSLSKPVVVNFIGFAPPARRIGNVVFASGLSDAAQLAVQLESEGVSAKSGASRATSGGYLRALFSGGTLAFELLNAMQHFVHPVFSNAPLQASQRLDDVLHTRAHTVLDLGEDEFTQGRLHPMMDNELRLRRLRQEAADPEVSVVLLDVVLGEGAHANPASELAPAIAEIKRQRAIDVGVVVVGTDDDPQNATSQMQQLSDAGADIFQSVEAAVEYVAQRLVTPPARDFVEVALDVFRLPFAAVNVGLESFHASLVAQGARAIHVDWRPPAGGNEKLMAILSRTKQRA